MENRTEIEEICREGMEIHNQIVNARSNIQNLLQLLSHHQQDLAALNQRWDVCTTQVRNHKFHDIGHARTALTKEHV